jgi:MYXO-CTERM domain-containing protein
MLTASLLLPVPITFAQTTNPTPETRVVETRTEPDRTGLWGLLGLVGLLGLTGLGRRREDVRSYPDPRERSRA